MPSYPVCHTLRSILVVESLPERDEALARVLVGEHRNCRKRCGTPQGKLRFLVKRRQGINVRSSVCLRDHTERATASQVLLGREIPSEKGSLCPSFGASSGYGNGGDAVVTLVAAVVLIEYDTEIG